jgi:hypothetical protein
MMRNAIPVLTERPMITLLPNVLFELLAMDCAVAGAVELGMSETALVEVLRYVPASVVRCCCH